MDRLTDVSDEELRRALDAVEGKKPTQRLIAAIAYKHGVTQTELAAWFGVQRKTIYNWLRRLEDEPIEDAVVDAQRPGRSRKLGEQEWEEFRRVVAESPHDAGYDESAWTPTLVRHHLRETYDVEYSLPSCRRLLREATA